MLEKCNLSSHFFLNESGSGDSGPPVSLGNEPRTKGCFVDKRGWGESGSVRGVLSGHPALPPPDRQRVFT